MPGLVIKQKEIKSKRLPGKAKGLTAYFIASTTVAVTSTPDKVLINGTA